MHLHTHVVQVDANRKGGAFFDTNRDFHYAPKRSQERASDFVRERFDEQKLVGLVDVLDCFDCCAVINRLRQIIFFSLGNR